MIIEVGPRDGFQVEKTWIPTELKVEIIADLVAAGVSHIQVASFVHPKLVPQMADAEALIGQLPRNNKVQYTGLCLNLKGVERAKAANLDAIDISISTSNTHSLKNANKSLQEARISLMEMIRFGKKEGLKVRAGLQCVFGCAYEGLISESLVLEMVTEIAAEGIDMLSLADSTGMATPPQMKRMLQRVQSISGDTPLVLHLHDTRGLGLANVVAAVESGVRWFDTAFGGMGGCPFIPNATGNIPTEDTVYLLESLGFSTGIDREKIAQISQKMAKFLQKEFSGKLYKL
jgi:hydroxymethylglutaryl-CoA lyase